MSERLLVRVPWKPGYVTLHPAPAMMTNCPLNVQNCRMVYLDIRNIFPCTGKYVAASSVRFRESAEHFIFVRP